MTNSELIKAVANRANFTQSDTKVLLRNFVEVMTEAAAAGEEIRISDFGKFFVKERPARTGVNPQTGEHIEITASKAVKFKASKALKEAANA